MENKVCFKCKELKPLSEFYPHSRMADGHLNKCKDCNKKDSRVQYNKNMTNDVFVKKERARLSAKNKAHPEYCKDYRKKYPEKYKAAMASRRLRTQNKGTVNHHWSYNEEHWKDCIELTINEHYQLHKHMTYDQERMMFRRADNNILLDSKDSHIEYLQYIKTLPTYSNRG